jgi:hypothetical protein
VKGDGGMVEPGKAGGGGGGAGLPGNGDKTNPPRGVGGGVGAAWGTSVTGVEVNPGGGMAGIGVEDISNILFSSFGCFEIFDLSNSSAELNKNPPCSCLFMFEHRLTNFSIVSQTTSTKLSSSVSERRQNVQEIRGVRFVAYLNRGKIIGYLMIVNE